MYLLSCAEFSDALAVSVCSVRVHCQKQEAGWPRGAPCSRGLQVRWRVQPLEGPQVLLRRKERRGVPLCGRRQVSRFGVRDLMFDFMGFCFALSFAAGFGAD
jgi:hypothetical protein